jgi:hypothetical protein
MAQTTKDASPGNQDLTEQVNRPFVDLPRRGLVVGRYNHNIKRPVVKKERYFRFKILDVIHDFLSKNAD